MTVLHELNYHGLKAGVKAGNVTPDGAVQCCAASLFLEHQAYDDGPLGAVGRLVATIPNGWRRSRGWSAPARR